MKQEQEYWTNRYEGKQTGWDIGHVSRPIKEYADQLNNYQLKILIPGAGNAYEAEYFWKKGFKNVHILDISNVPLQQFKSRNPDFPDSQIHHVNFFEFDGKFDLIIEQTFFCSMLPTYNNRAAYAKQMYTLLKPNGKLVGLWFNFPLVTNTEKRPFGGDKKEYTSYLSPYFEMLVFEKCHNSIKPREGKELFGIFRKKVEM